jgi:hypothetical protein
MKDKSRMSKFKQKVLKPITFRFPFIGPLLCQRDSLRNQLVKLKQEKQQIESSLNKALKEHNRIEKSLNSLKCKSQYQKVSYSQDGEDQILFFLLNNVENMFVEYHLFKNKEQELGKLLELLRRNSFRYFVETIKKSKYPYINFKENCGQMDLQVNIFAVKV